jgi:Fe-S cluster biogenesis protein NfuA
MSLIFEDVQKELQEVRPYLIVDGGDIELVEVTEKNIVKVKLLGACNKCPMASMTLRAGVEKVLMRKIPDIKRVEAVNL